MQTFACYAVAMHLAESCVLQCSHTTPELAQLRLHTPRMQGCWICCCCACNRNAVGHQTAFALQEAEEMCCELKARLDAFDRTYVPIDKSKLDEAEETAA